MNGAAGPTHPQSFFRGFVALSGAYWTGPGQWRARLMTGALALLGVAQVASGIAQAWLLASLLAALLGFGAAGWAELGAAAALALLSAGLGVAQERALVAAGEAAKARLRATVFDRLLAEGPADQRPIGERAALIVDRIEALEGFLTRWLPAAVLAVAGPLLDAGAAATQTQETAR